MIPAIEDDLAKVSLACVASFGSCQIRHTFYSYGVFIFWFHQFRKCLGVLVIVETESICAFLR